MMADITLSDALSLANGAKKAISEGYDVPMMMLAAARLADELDNIKASAEAAKEELRKAREQEPVLCKAAFSNGDGTYSYDYVTWPLRKHQKPVHPVEHFYYTTPKPAAYGVDDATAQHIALAVYDYQNRISDEQLMHAINRILIKGSHLLSAEYLAQMQAPKPAAPAVSDDNPVQWLEDEGDMILVPRGLLGAACSSIDKQRPAPKVLEALRYYTMNAQQAPDVPAPSVPDATCKGCLQVQGEMREVLTGLVAIAEKKGKRQGSPNHCHARPGICDDDNGVLAGKPCAECAMYDRARALLGDTP